MSFSSTLQSLLVDRKLKQADICRMTGIQTSLMSDYLGGKKSPTIGNAILIADAFHISLDALVGRQTDPNARKKATSKTLDRIYEACSTLTDEEQLFLLDMIAALKQHFKKAP